MESGMRPTSNSATAIVDTKMLRPSFQTGSFLPASAYIAAWFVGRTPFTPSFFDEEHKSTRYSICYFTIQ